jgi:ribose 5-phosphate isomerase B
MNKIYLASDHAGFGLKDALAAFLSEHGYIVDDLGPTTFNKDDDYPDLIAPLARAVAEDKHSLGIAIGASGQGEAIAANRIKGVRAVVYYGPARGVQTDSSGKQLDLLLSTRAHNDANVLCLGARFITQEEAKEKTLLWLQTPFSNEERHVRRIARLDTLVD